MKFLQDRSLDVRKRIAIIASGIVGIVLVLVLIFLYTHPHPAKHDPESAIDGIYTTITIKIQSLFHHK
jgi:hypothetical protein